MTCTFGLYFIAIDVLYCFVVLSIGFGLYRWLVLYRSACTRSACALCSIDGLCSIDWLVITRLVLYRSACALCSIDRLVLLIVGDGCLSSAVSAIDVIDAAVLCFVDVAVLYRCALSM